MINEKRNYIELHSYLPWRKNFAYVDTTRRIADRLFIDKKIIIKFKGDFSHKEDGYIIVLASCRNRDWDDVKKVLLSMHDKMILIGKSDYSQYCESLIVKLEKAGSELRERKKQRKIVPTSNTERSDITDISAKKVYCKYCGKVLVSEGDVRCDRCGAFILHDGDEQ